MDEILKSEIILVLLEKDEGVYFEEFSGLFHQIHGYQLKLTNYGYKSLKDLLDDMKDEVELLNSDGQQVIKYRSACQLNVISPCMDTSFQNNDPNISDNCSASCNKCWSLTGDIPLDKFPKEHPLCEQTTPGHLLTSRENHKPPILCHEYSTATVVVEVNPSKPKNFHSIQKPSNEIVEIISKKVISSYMGLKPKTLTKYVMGQHNIDLEMYSKQLGYKDIESMLMQIPGIGFADNSRKNVLIALSSQDTSQKSQPVQLQKDSFSWNKVVDVLRLFPSGFRVANLKKYVLNAYDIDLEVLSLEHGFLDVPSMLKQVPGITSLNGDVFIASDIYESTVKHAQVRIVKFSEEALVDFLKAFPSGLKVKKLIKHMKKQNKIDLMKYSQENGFTDIIGMLKKIPGITVVGADVVMCSDVYQTCHPIYKAIDKARIAKCPKNNVHIPQVTKTVTKPSTKPTTGSVQQTPLPTRQTPSTNSLINRPQNVQQQGLRPNVSYASACAANLKKDQNNVQSLQCHSNFNVEKVHTAKAATPNYKEAPKGVLPSPEIKDNLRLLLKSHANGLSIFQLKKLYLLKFKQPFVCKGLSARKLFMNMKDVAKIKGVGVQMKVFSALPEEDPSVSAKKHEDSTLQGAATSVAEDGKKNEVLPHLQISSPLLIKNRTAHLRKQPSTSRYNQTELTGGQVPISGSDDITSHKHHDRKQPMTEKCGRKLPKPAVSNPSNNPSTMGSQFTWVNTSLEPAAMAGNISDAQWPLLPQKFNVLKEIEQRAKVSQELKKNIQHNNLCFRETSNTQPQEEDNIAQNLLQAHQDPYKANRQQESQILNLVHPTPQPDFSFVMEEVGFSFVKAKSKADKDIQPLQILCTGPPPTKFTDSAQLALSLSEEVAVSNTHATPLQLNQTASCRGGSVLRANVNSVNVPTQQKTSNFSSQKVPQQTYSHLMTSDTMVSSFPMANNKSIDPESQQNPTNYFNQNVDSLFLERKSQQATNVFSQTSLQALELHPNCGGEQEVSMPSKQQQEASHHKGIVNFEKIGSTPAPSKQEITNTNLKNGGGLPVSPKPPSPEKASNSQTKFGSQEIVKEQSLPRTQTVSYVAQGSLPVSQIHQQVPVIPSIDTESYILCKNIDLNIVNRQIDLRTQQKEHSQTTDGIDEVETSPSSAQQNVNNTGDVYTHGKTVTKPLHTQHTKEVPPPNMTSSVKQSRSSPTKQYNFNTSVSGHERLTSQPYQYFSPVLRHELSGYPVVTFDQSSSDDSSEESTKTWQKDSETFCCIL